MERIILQMTAMIVYIGYYKVVRWNYLWVIQFQVYKSPIMSSLFSSIITVTCDESERDETVDGINDVGDVADILSFPALSAALTTCYMALRERNNFLMSVESDKHDSGEWRTLGNQHSKLSPGYITTLENTLLKPEMVNSMALLSTGLVRNLKFDRFFEEAGNHSFG